MINGGYQSKLITHCTRSAVYCQEEDRLTLYLHTNEKEHKLTKRTLRIHKARHLQNKADAMQILNETI